MKVTDLKSTFIEFQVRLNEHYELWSKSLNSSIPEYSIRNTEELKRQAKWLSHRLGGLRPYLERFKDSWIMKIQLTGTVWNALDSAVTLNDTAGIKGPSLRNVISEIDKIIGRLESMNPDDDIPVDNSKQIKPGIDYDRVILGYLEKLHPYIYESCSNLFIDGHYTQAIEESIKAVYEYIRRKTNLDIDGENLVNKVFGKNKPILSFGSLDNKNIYNEQVGFMNMLKGFYQGVRHPLAHTQGKKEKMIKAFEYLVMASLFCRRIDDANKITSSN